MEYIIINKRLSNPVFYELYNSAELAASRNQTGLLLDLIFVAIDEVSLISGWNFSDEIQAADLTNVMVRVNLTGSDTSDVVFVEVLLLPATFFDTNIKEVDFTDAILDEAQVKNYEKASCINFKTGVDRCLGCK